MKMLQKFMLLSTMAALLVLAACGQANSGKSGMFLPLRIQLPSLPQKDRLRSSLPSQFSRTSPGKSEAKM